MYRKLALACEVCDEIPEQKQIDKNEFAFVAHSEMLEWSDFKDEVPELEERIWRRSDNRPSPGEIRTVFVKFPFHYEMGECFHTLFMPANVAVNGWECAKDIEDSAIVACQFQDVLKENEHYAWIRVKVIEIMTLLDLKEKIPPIQCRKYVENIINNKDSKVEKFENWTIYEWSVQGDLGEWALDFKDEIGKMHMVLYSKWDFHEESVYCGNFV